MTKISKMLPDSPLSLELASAMAGMVKVLVLQKYVSNIHSV